jgi:hypothetical protein
MLGPLPAHPHTRKRWPDGLPAHWLLGEPLLEAHLCGHLKRPQAALLAELPGAPMKHLAQSLRPLLVEGSMNGARGAVGTPSQCLLEALLVEDVDGVARRLRVTAEVAGDLVGVLAIGAGEQDLAERRKVKASGERNPASKVSRSASLKGRTKIGRFMT